MTELFSRLWQSSTMMTWLNTAARVLSLAVVMPLVLRQFTPGDIALYYLFASIIALQLMAGSGFVPTFARFVSYSLAGATLKDLERLREGRLQQTIDRPIDDRVVAEIVATLHRVFLVLSLGTVPLMAAVGSALLVRPVGLSSDPTHAWYAWLIVLLITPLTLYANQYSAILQGANRVAIEQRWSAVFVILGSLFGIGVLLTGGGLLALIAANQLWLVASFFRLRWLARKTLTLVPFSADAARYSPAVFRAIWPSSWKSFLGVAASGGITSASGLVFAQRLPATALAEFLLGLRVMSIVAEISRAPFYSKLPVFNTLRARNDLGGLRRTALRGMRLAYVGYLMLFVAAPLVAGIVLPRIGSQVAFPSIGFWCLLGAAVLVERFGAMHIQLYSTTNHIIWHWLNGATGVLWIGAMIVLVPSLGLYAYPVAMLLAYALIYTRISVQRSMRSLSESVWRFERTGFVPAAAAYVFATLLLMLPRLSALPI